jgi:hypothetical protein
MTIRSALPSRREYFLAQIQEKDRIIETLLRQVSYLFIFPITHTDRLLCRQLYNPYQATPLSIKSYEETATRAAQLDADVRLWRSKLEDGARTAAPLAGAPTLPLGDDSESDASTAPRPDKGDSPLDAAHPVAMLEALSISKEGTEDGDSVNSMEGEKRVPLPEHRKSELVNHGLVTEADVDALFEM